MWSIIRHLLSFPINPKGTNEGLVFMLIKNGSVELPITWASWNTRKGKEKESRSIMIRVWANQNR